jgi:hypothetical protein
MFDAMRALVKNSARSRKKPARSRITRSTRGTVDRALHLTLVGAQSSELKDIEGQYVLERDRWMARFEDLVPVYGQ